MDIYGVQDPDRPIFEAIGNEQFLFIGDSSILNTIANFEPVLRYVSEIEQREIELISYENINAYFSAYLIDYVQ